MKMSEVIKRGGDGDTDPGRVSEGQEVHMGPRPACLRRYYPPPFSSVPLGPQVAWHTDMAWLACWARGGRRRGWWSWHPGEVEGETGWRGVDWVQTSPVAPEPLPGSLPWQPGHTAWSKHPLPWEERRKTTAWRDRRCKGKDRGDKRGRARTIGTLPGIMASCWPTGAQPWWTSDWQALALL